MPVKNILLTGGGGFIGRHIKGALDGRYHFFAPRSFELDIRDYDNTARYADENKIEAIIHCASYNDATTWSERVLEADLKMYFNLEKISRNLDRMIYFGSGAEYDKRFDVTMVTENDIGKSIPVDGYGFAKYIMTRHARASRNIYNLRLFGIFGRYEDWTRKFISNLCCKAGFDLPLTIRKECEFDFVWVEDLPEVVAWFLENEPLRHDYNFCYGEPVKLTELADMVLWAAGKRLPVVMLSPERNLDYTASNEQLKGLFSEFKLTPLETAVEKLYEYYYNIRDSVDVNVLRETR